MLKLEMGAVTVKNVVGVCQRIQSSQITAVMKLQQLRMTLILSMVYLVPNVAHFNSTLKIFKVYIYIYIHKLTFHDKEFEKVLYRD